MTTTHYLLDGGNVIGEVEGDAATTYLRGVNLISSNGTYYLYNAHGDVVQLTNTNGELTRNYNYDAFGNERDPDEDDINPFRYCGEYYDTETGLYYLRARYYDPLIGRFTQEDTHWNTANMIYGDNPQKINEREDALGLKCYSYAPHILSIIQSGNQYLYCASNPVLYSDFSGNSIALASSAVASLSSYSSVIIGGISAAIASISAGIVTSPAFAIGAVCIVAGVIALTVVIRAVSEFESDITETIIWTKAQIKNRSVDKNKLNKHTVYVIIHNPSNCVAYVGRTSNFPARYRAHQKGSNPRFSEDLYTMIPVYTGLSLSEARALEQTLITAFLAYYIANSINSIAKANYPKFAQEFEFVQNLISCYFDD